MQVFLVGTPYETAIALDYRRRNKQIIECNQILKAIENPGAGWFNHPVVKMYTYNTDFLRHYKATLELYRAGRLDEAMKESEIALRYKPTFYCEKLFKQMKRRLYTKDNKFYEKWSDFGETNVNLYYVDYQWVAYKNGKKVPLEEAD